MNRIIAFAASALALAVAAPASADPVYDAFTTFNGTNGAGGFNWVAGTLPSPTPLGAVTCVISDTICLGLANGADNLPGVFKSTGVPSASHPYQPLDRLLIHPGSLASLNGVFVAPTSGIYDYSLSFDALTPGTSVFISAFSTATGVNSPLGTAGLLTATSGPRTYTGTLTLAAGQLIGFNLNNAGNYSSDSTGLRFTVTQLTDPGAVPEPATWAMTIAGFAMLGGVLRTRRRGEFARASRQISKGASLTPAAARI